MPRVQALCSCPRVGFTDFAGHVVMAFAQNNCAYDNLYGAYWSQALSEGIRKAVDSGFDYIITTDYDSIFKREEVAQMIRLMEQNPHADAICSMQMGRFSGLLVSTESGEMSKKELLENPLVRIKTGHFGLTIFRALSFIQLEKPWFSAVPNSNGDWENDTDKIDADIAFWDNFARSGKKLYLAPRVVIGHLELLIKFPDENLEGIYETVNHYHKHGPPQDIWK